MCVKQEPLLAEIYLGVLVGAMIKFSDSIFDTTSSFISIWSCKDKLNINEFDLIDQNQIILIIH